MKSYPSSELRNVCDEQEAAADTAAVAAAGAQNAQEGEDMLQQMLDRRWATPPSAVRLY